MYCTNKLYRDEIMDNKEIVLNSINPAMCEEITDLRFEFTANVAITIKERRKQLKITQEQLSKMSNVNRTTIAKLESFQRLIVNVDIILKLLDALGLKLFIGEK